MANVIQTATNRFSKGLVLDLSPETTREVELSILLSSLILYNKQLDKST